MDASKSEKPFSPAILAPAGSRPAFLAALAAGADAVYCGLKQFSARMEAHNFSIEELAALTELAHSQGTRVYAAVNTLIKTAELGEVARLFDQLQRRVRPDAVILQDIGLVALIRQTGYSGQLNLSTLANVSSPAALRWVGSHLPVDRVVIPRELDVDEIKAMAAACPPHMDLEVFVHGALCYGVSGRCYWSSFLGGKSGLRGRCVQPCRRLYRSKDKSQRFFSCQDLSLDVLVKVLMAIPKVKSWKIEGRKKGPHYVYYTVQAYRMLRDHGRDPQSKRAALQLLELALGRTATHYHFLPQRSQNPLTADGKTASGLYAGAVQGGRQPYLSPRLALLPGDVLRIGYEDEAGHAIRRVGRAVPKKGRLALQPAAAGAAPAKGSPVFLIDRREEALQKLLQPLEAAFQERLQAVTVSASGFRFRAAKTALRRKAPTDIILYRQLVGRAANGARTAFWLSEQTIRGVSVRNAAESWWCLPPVIWPKEESNLSTQINEALGRGARNFILNAPWQKAYFPERRALNIWAGPFCNLTNPLAVATLAAAGFKGAIVSPELGREDYLELPRTSPLPLGIVIGGDWPLCISRIFTEQLPTEVAFASPRGEKAWGRRQGSDYWIYPNWRLDIRPRKKLLQEAGYAVFLYLEEPTAAGVARKRRPGLWNWELGLD